MPQYHSSGLTAKGPPAIPFWLTIVRGAIIVLSLGVLIAAAYNLSIFDGFASYVSGYSGPSGFLIFDAIFTWLILGFMLVSEFFAPNLYFRILFVVALTLNAIFWLAAWAWAASAAASWNSYWWDGDNSDAYGASMAAEAALGALVWVLVVVTLGFFIHISLSSPDDSPRAVEAHNAELGQVNMSNEPKHTHVQPTAPVQPPSAPYPGT